MNHHSTIHGQSGAPAPAPALAPDADVAIIGAGILGLFNAIQLAKRGLRVVLIDNIVGQKRSYKVGESFLLFTNAFLRTVGGMEEFLETCFPKLGVWFVYGAEGAPSLDAASEWAVRADPYPPHCLHDMMKHDKWFRSMFLDVQIVRPDAEDFLCEAARRHPNITFLDAARVKEVALEDREGLHVVTWVDAREKEASTTRARWVLDCSGRNRFLAKRLGHAVDMSGDLETTAVWGQWGGITDELFDERWVYTHPDGEKTARDRYTVHLWGAGYWIWVIRLSGDRISVGVTFDKDKPPPGATPKEQFWSIIHRYPLLAGVLSEDRLLEFRTYRDVQHLTDTFVSRRRYGMAGDAASIIDAYYSQGMSLGMLTSWHLANIIERDVREGRLDEAYIDRVNRATTQDWEMMRNMIREKYSPAMQDGRFFLLSHILDMMIFWSTSGTRASLTRWLVDTDGDTAKETPELKKARALLEARLFYSQSAPWDWLDPELVQRVQRRLQTKLAERARFRLAHGIEVPRAKSVLGLTAPVPRIWSLLFRRREEVVDISATDVAKPAAKGGVDLPVPMSVPERLSWVLRLRGSALLALFTLAYAHDWADTGLSRLRVALGERAGAKLA